MEFPQRVVCGMRRTFIVYARLECSRERERLSMEGRVLASRPHSSVFSWYSHDQLISIDIRASVSKPLTAERRAKNLNNFRWARDILWLISRSASLSGEREVKRQQQHRKSSCGFAYKRAKKKSYNVSNKNNKWNVLSHSIADDVPCGNHFCFSTRAPGKFYNATECMPFLVSLSLAALPELNYKHV